MPSHRRVPIPPGPKDRDLETLERWNVLHRLSGGTAIPTREFAEALLRRTAESFPLMPRPLYVEPIVAAYQTLEIFRRKSEPENTRPIPETVLEAYFDFLMGYEYLNESREPTPAFEAEIREYQRKHGLLRRKPAASESD